MEHRNLPNATVIIVLGIFGYLCCCFSGLGIIPAGIAYILAIQSQKLYNENPEEFLNYDQIKTGKIVALIALILNVLIIIRIIYVISTVGWDEMMEQSREMMEQWGIEE